ncbi:MAG: DUF2400 family protein [Candidatus Bathyarchaeia archaeon]|jgi:hypothetical protein
MTEQVPNDLKDLIVRFVQTYGGVTDLELDLHLHPKPSFMPLNSYPAKREAAHYFLLAASLSDYQLTGNPRNIRLLLNHLATAFEGKLYTIRNPFEFKREVDRFEQEIRNLDHLGEAKAEIPEVLCSVNQFAAQKANGDLIDFTTKLSHKGRKPKDFVETLSYSVKRMNKQHKSKSWLYLRWMVRGPPDLGLFQFDPKDLMVSLNTPKLRVYVALGLSDNDNLPFELNSKNKPDSWWENTAQFDADANRLTEFACSLFPDDPAKIDFPFFILGTWLEYSDLTPISLERSLRFFIQKHQELLGPLMRYLTVVYHYNRVGELIEPGAFTAFEREVYDYLKKKQIISYYEFMEFKLSQENQSLTYKPDFLLPQLTNNGRKVLLEPHGIKTNLREFLNKTKTFRKHYDKYFCLILIVPDDFTKTIDNLDPEHNTYDFLWKQSNYKIQLENFHST